MKKELDEFMRSLEGWESAEMRVRSRPEKKQQYWRKNFSLGGGMGDYLIVVFCRKKHIFVSCLSGFHPRMLNDLYESDLDGKPCHGFENAFDSFCEFIVKEPKVTFYYPVVKITTVSWGDNEIENVTDIISEELDCVYGDYRTFPVIDYWMEFLI
jgi:hypothetical protein